MRLLVIGSINRDMVITLPKVPADGETVMSENISYYPGGKGANQAVAAARLGTHTALIGCVGGDENGRYMVQSLRDSRVDTRYLLSTGQPTGLAVITVDGGGANRIIVHPGANSMVSVDTVKKALEEPWNAMLLQWELPLETVFAAAGLAAEKNIPVIMDPAPAVPLSGLSLPGGLSALTPNESEAETLTGLSMSTPGNAEKVIRRLAEYSKIVLLKMGSRGALLYTDGEITHFPAQPAEVVDTTGAGDAFTAAFTVKYITNGDLTAAIKYANAAGALCVSRKGAQPAMPAWQEVNAYMKEQ